jgi:hypothetical protein
VLHKLQTAGWWVGWGIVAVLWLIFFCYEPYEGQPVPDETLVRTGSALALAAIYGCRYLLRRRKRRRSMYHHGHDKAFFQRG